MKPAPLEYFDPTTLKDAISLLEQHQGEAKILAGGQSLIPLLNMRLARPRALVDLRRISELDYIREIDGGLALGAMTTKRTVEDSALVRSKQPLLHTATRLIAHPQIRNRGTVGGSLAQADPAAEYPALALVLGAELRALGPQGARSIPADDFFITYLTTALEPTEILVEMRVPFLEKHTGWSFREIARRHGDFALAGVAVTTKRERGGSCAAARIVLFGVAPTPVRALEAEQIVRGARPSEELFEQAARKAAEAIDEPLSDVHASAEYRRHLAQVLTRRALGEAMARVEAQ